MGAQRILQAVVVASTFFVALGSLVAAPDPKAAPAREARERIAVIDLGPDPANDTVRRQIAGSLVAAGFAAVIGDGVEDALAGISIEADAAQSAAALAEAQRAYGAFDCKATISSAQTVAGIGAARQAAGLPIPEVAKAWALILLCADRTSNTDLAMRAAHRLRIVGGSPDVPADILAKYPEVDTTSDRELVPLEISSDVPNAAIYVDYQKVGVAPLTIAISAGNHVLAAAAGSRRGWASGNAVRTQTKLQIPTADNAGGRSALARRVAGWNGAMPSPTELGAVLSEVNARVAIIRRGDQLQVWGRAAKGAEAPHLLGGEDGKGPLSELERMLALVDDRSKTWKDRAPDPDQPLLVEDRDGKITTGGPRRDGGADRNPRTKWWVYASIAGAVVAGAVLVYSLDAGSDRQRVELVYPGGQP